MPRSRASTSARRACAAPKTSSASTTSPISRCSSCRSSASASCGKTLRSNRVHGRPAPSRRSRRGAARAAQRARARRRDAPHGVRALRQGRRLHAPGVLPAGRRTCLGRRNTLAGRCARGAAGEASARSVAARRSGLPARGGVGRRAAAPAGSRLLGAAAVRVSRRRRAALRPLGETSAVQPSLRPDGTPAASGADRRVEPPEQPPPRSCSAAR